MRIPLLVVSVMALLAAGAADAKKGPGASDYVVVVGWDAQNNKPTYKDSKSGADATELHVKHMKAIEWQPEHANAQTLSFDFTSNSNSPFADSESPKGTGKVFIPRHLRKLNNGESSARYKYSVTLTEADGTAHSDDPIIIIEQ